MKKTGVKNITIKKSSTGKKTRIETFDDEFNNVYYNILNPPQKETENIETLLKEIEFYKVQLLAEKNINQSLSNEISQLNEIQKLVEKNKNNNNKGENKLIEEINILEKKNKFLEDSVLKLKNALDHANRIFPNFLLKLKSSNNNKISINEDNYNNKDEELSKFYEENKILKNTINNMDEMIVKLKNENAILN